MIYGHVFSAYERRDWTNVYHRHRVDTAFLQTCRSVYLEAHTVPFDVNSVDDIVCMLTINNCVYARQTGNGAVCVAWMCICWTRTTATFAEQP